MIINISQNNFSHMMQDDFNVKNVLSNLILMNKTESYTTLILPNFSLDHY